MDKFTCAYIECALWSSTFEDAENGREDMPMDSRFDVTDIAPKALKEIVADCADFQESQASVLTQAYEVYSHSPEWSHEEQAGHDFWLTRNRHGAGFWDRGLGEIGTRLTDAAHLYGSCDLYVGDDGKVYC